MFSFSWVICSVEKYDGHISPVISDNTIVRLVSQTAGHLSSALLSLSSPLPGLSCTLSWQPCRHAVSPPELKDSAAPWMCLSWEADEKESLRGREKKSGVGEARDGIDGGEK